MNEHSVTCFGTGDGWPCSDRNHSSFLYRFGKTSVLIDCGEPIDRSYKASGLSYDAIDAIFLSHLHADHFGGLFMLLQGCWLEHRRKPLTIHMPRRGIRPLRQMVEAGLIFEELLPFRLGFSPLKPGTKASVRGVRVTPFRTTHLERLRKHFSASHRGADFNAHCFLLESGGVRAGHSADLGKPEDLAPLLQKPLELLVCEVAHFTPEQIFSYLGGHQIGRILFTHLARPYREKMPEVRRLAKRLLRGIPHQFVEDFDTVGF